MWILAIFAIGAWTIPSDLTAKVWSKQLWVEAQKELWFMRMASKMEPTGEKVEATGVGSIICIKEDLTKSAGDTIVVPLLVKLTGDGKTGDDKLEDEEEDLTFYDFSVTVNQLRNGVRTPGLMAEQKRAFSMRNAAKIALKIWLKEKMDEEMFYALGYAPTSNRRRIAGGHADLTSLTTSDVLVTTDISLCKRKAKLANPKIRPAIVDGREMFVIILHPYQSKALVAESAWQNAQRNANIRGEKNPLFSGALGVWDGVIIHEHELIETAAIGADLPGTSENVAVAAARALFLGAQAGVYAYAKHTNWVEQSFDYQNQTGFATAIIYEAAKTIFNSEDYGMIALDTYYAAD